MNADGVRLVKLGPEHRDELMRVDQAAFSFDPSGIDNELDTAALEWDRTWGAVRPAAGPQRHTSTASWAAEEELAGVMTAYTQTLTVPGVGADTRGAAMSGLSWVSVHPDHRRRGVLTAMMRQHLQDVHESATEAISGLFAAETVIYPRYGYGEASGGLSLTLPRDAALRPLRAGFAARVSTQLSTVASTPEALDVVTDVHARAANRPGRVSRSRAQTRQFLRERPEDTRGKEPKKILVARIDGRPTGYALLRREPKWTDGSPEGSVDVHELVGLDPASTHALWTRVLGFDLMAKVQAPPIGLDDPLLVWLEDVRAAAPRLLDGLWLRLVDVDRALVARGYSSDVDVVLAVEDEVCPWNAGSWRLTVIDGEATCTPTQQAAEVSLQVRDLAACYLGGHTLAALERAGLVREHRPGTVTELSRALRFPVEAAVPPMF